MLLNAGTSIGGKIPLDWKMKALSQKKTSWEQSNVGPSALFLIPSLIKLLKDLLYLLGHFIEPLYFNFLQVTNFSLHY